MKEELWTRRFIDLSERSYHNNQYTFTPFLGEAEVSDLFSVKKELLPSGFSMDGGYPQASRMMVRFGTEDELGYEEEFPIQCLRIVPLLKKFADDLTHRDFLGAIMNLSIERGEIGDIVVVENEAFLFCTQKMAPFICEQLTKVKHTAVRCEISVEIPKESLSRTEKLELLAASERIDIFLAKACHLSRSACLLLFQTKKIFVNGRLMENNSYQMKEGDTISARGYGKFCYRGISGLTKKGNRVIQYEKYTG